MVLDKQFIFIIGAPKSGTTWLQIMLGAHPVVCTTVELTLFNRYIAPWIKAWKGEAANIAQGRWYQGLPFLWTEDDFYEFLRGFLSKVYERVLATKPQATHILDKHPGYSLHVEDINELLPNARFIHMIRDGRDVAVSMVAARRQIGYGPGTISDSATAWKRYVRAAQKAKQYHGRYIEVRYEDLSTAGIDTLKCVFDFCDLPASVEDVAANLEAHQFERMKAKRQHADDRVKTHEAFYRKGRVGSWQEELNPMQRYIFDEIAGDLLRELGYAEGRWWAESGRQAFTLPVWAAILTRKQQLRRGAALIAAALLGPRAAGYVKSKVKRKMESAQR